MFFLAAFRTGVLPRSSFSDDNCFHFHFFPHRHFREDEAENIDVDDDNDVIDPSEDRRQRDVGEERGEEQYGSPGALLIYTLENQVN